VSAEDLPVFCCVQWLSSDSVVNATSQLSTCCVTPYMSLLLILVKLTCYFSGLWTIH